METHIEKLKIKTQEELEDKIRTEHIEDHRIDPNYLCKYCIRDRLEKLDNTIIPATPSKPPHDSL